MQISNISYVNIRGTSAEEEAVVLKCSRSSPCFGIDFEDVNLTYNDGAVVSRCENIANVTSGLVQLDGCL